MAARLGVGGRPRAIGCGKPRSIPVPLVRIGGRPARNRFAGTVFCAPRATVAWQLLPGPGGALTFLTRKGLLRASVAVYGRVFRRSGREAIPCSTRSVVYARRRLTAISAMCEFNDRIFRAFQVYKARSVWRRSSRRQDVVSPPASGPSSGGSVPLVQRPGRAT
jgi:hypothetical protein